MSRGGDLSVSIVKCKNYDRSNVRKALIQSLDNIGFKFKSGIKVLIKPNLLSPQNPAEGITTHPILVEELCKILKNSGVSEIYIGDSSAYDTDKAIKACGFSKLSKYAKLINFESEEKEFYNLGKGFSAIPLPKILFKVDLVIDFAKLKTHTLTGVTLCTKNLYGCIPGTRKEHYHKLFPDIKQFSRLLNHLEEKIKPRLCFIDGVLGLEGEGPGTSGSSIKSKVLIAGRNAGAVDIVASELMGFNPNKIYTNRNYKIKREEISVVGDGKNISYSFKKPSTSLGSWFIWLLKFLPSPKIISDKEKCRRCGLCVKKCPVHALSLNPNAVCNHKICIKCLCCVEVCPYKAIYLNHNLIKFLMNIYSIFSKKK